MLIFFVVVLLLVCFGFFLILIEEPDFAEPDAINWFLNGPNYRRLKIQSKQQPTLTSF